jgi:hypothetical protein
MANVLILVCQDTPSLLRVDIGIERFAFKRSIAGIQCRQLSYPSPTRRHWFYIISRREHWNYLNSFL